LRGDIGISVFTFSGQFFEASPHFISDMSDLVSSHVIENARIIKYS
jgi:hypothetical protein